MVMIPYAPDASPAAPPPLSLLRSHIAAASAARHSSANLNFVIVTASLLALLLLVLLLNIFFRLLLRKFVSSQQNGGGSRPPCRLQKAQLDALIPAVVFNPTMSVFTPDLAPSPKKTASISKMAAFTHSAFPQKMATPQMSAFTLTQMSGLRLSNPLPNPTPHVLTPLPRIGLLHHDTNQIATATVVGDPYNHCPNILIHLDANLDHPYNPCPNILIHPDHHLDAKLDHPYNPCPNILIHPDHHLDANLDHPCKSSPNILIHPDHHLDANLDHPCNPSRNILIHPDHHLDANLDHSALVIDSCPNLFTPPHHHLDANLDMNIHADSECAICLLLFRPLDVLRIMPKCMHRFHASCIDTWLALNSSCPICRHDILDSAPFQLEKRPTH